MGHMGFFTLHYCKQRDRIKVCPSRRPPIQMSLLRECSVPVRSYGRLTKCSRHSFTNCSTREWSSTRVVRGKQSVVGESTERRQIRMLLVGSPGSGKGTLSGYLHSDYPSLTNISAGDLLRNHIKHGTSIGQKANSVIKAGKLMPDEIMMSIVGSKVNELNHQDWLLDGFPRTLGQAKLLDEELYKNQKKLLNLVVNLIVPEEIILARILNRWVHPASGRVYNLAYNPPKSPGLDDVTGEALEQRSDDNESTFKSRLESFHLQTDPMISHYRSKCSKHLKIDQDAENAEVDRIQSQLQEINQDQTVFVDIKGKESTAIWPKLKAVIQARFGV